MNRRHLVATTLATAVLSGPAEVDSFVERITQCLGRKHRWITPMCRRMFQRFGSSLSPRSREQLIEWIEQDRGYEDAWARLRVPKIYRYPIGPTRMSPRTGALQACELPSIPTPGDLAAWLGVSIGELDWF